MEWKTSLIQQLPWSGDIINQAAKARVAKEVAGKIQEGETVGVGSGSTVYMALLAIARRIKEENLRVCVIPASAEISMACMQLGIPQATLLESRPDWTFDGADEVYPDHNLLKGRGGALFKEKLLMSCSPVNYILVDESKLVKQLGEHFPVPVEIFPGALTLVEDRLRLLGADKILLRPAKGKDGPVYTENGNWILDVHFLSVHWQLEKQVKEIPGVIESGLFYGYPLHVLVAKAAITDGSGGQ